MNISKEISPEQSTLQPFYLFNTSSFRCLQVRRSEMLAKHVTAVKEMPLVPIPATEVEEKEEGASRKTEDENLLRSSSPSLMEEEEELAAGSEGSISDLEEGLLRPKL